MNLAAIPDWFDEMHGAYARNLNRILEGRRFHDEGDETAGYDFRVDRVTSVTVGIDSAGIFAGITVIDTEGAEWTFYSHGAVAGADDVTVGRHSLALGPDPSPTVGRTPPDPLFDLAVGLARAQWPEAS